MLPPPHYPLLHFLPNQFCGHWKSRSAQRKELDFMTRKLLLKCGYSAGDIVMLTAAVRDLHKRYPGRFLTDVRTPFPEVWENNPFITPLDEADPGVEVID